ncbi:MAG: ribosome maturation factor RimM [Bacteroidia bacterium]
MSQLIKIGKLTRVHGLKGAIVVSGDNLYNIEIKKNDFLFIEINNIPTPFFISEVNMIGKNLVLAFDGIKTIDKAKALIGKEVYADEKNISLKKSKTTSLQGYDLVDKLKGNMGKITELIALPKQQLISVQIEGEETLLPYTDEFVKRVDHKTKTVYYCAPDGLFDINT